MQGLLYHYFRTFVEESFGSAAWERACECAGVPGGSFVLTRQYPDRYLRDLLEALTDKDVPADGAERPNRRNVLFRFGRRLGASFKDDFGHYFERFGSAREMLSAIEPVIHAELRRRDPTARPPELRVTPIAGGRLRLVYASPRRLCALARGLVDYVAEAFGETAVVVEPACVERGDARCEMIIAFNENGSRRSVASPPVR